MFCPLLRSWINFTQEEDNLSVLFIFTLNARRPVGRGDVGAVVVLAVHARLLSALFVHQHRAAAD
jgi:hypothetical protein